MGELSLSLEDGLRLVAKEKADADVRVVGALTVAVILTKTRGHEFTRDMIATIGPLIEFLHAELIPHAPLPNPRTRT